MRPGSRAAVLPCGRAARQPRGRATVRLPAAWPGNRLCGQAAVRSCGRAAILQVGISLYAFSLPCTLVMPALRSLRAPRRRGRWDKSRAVAARSGGEGGAVRGLVCGCAARRRARGIEVAAQVAARRDGGSAGGD